MVERLDPGPPACGGPALLDEGLATETGPRREGDEETRLPTVSVVVPVLDAEDDIGRLLVSLSGLDYPPARVEIIVVDNGSSDDTARIVSRFPVRLLSETRTRSSYAARNRGIAAATGEWIAFTDADCAADPEWLRRLLAPPVPEAIGAVAGEVLAFESRTPVQRLTERFGIMRHAVTLPHKGLPCFSTANVAVRRDLLVAIGGFRKDVRFFGDMELSWRMQLERGAGILFRPEAVVRHRHRRTLRQLWRHGVQHGRGVAFMRRTYPERYTISVKEQAGRLGLIAKTAIAAVTGQGGREGGGIPSDGVHSIGEVRSTGDIRDGSPYDASIGSDDLSRRVAHEPPRPARDRFYAPLFLALWYGGMAAGYLMGPAWSRPSQGPAEGTPR